MVPLGLIQAVSDPNGGKDLLVEAVNTFRELADQWGLAFASLNPGGALLQHHRYADAIPHLEFHFAGGDGCCARDWHVTRAHCPVS